MSEPTSPDFGGPERLHPLFLLSGLGAGLRQLAGGYALLGYLIVSGQFKTAASVALALIAITLIGTFLYWRKFQFRVGSREIRIDSGIFSRTHRSIPFDRVQDVDISQGPVARLLGMASVRFETGGASGGKADEGVLQAVPLERAEALRALVRGRRSEAPHEATIAEPEAQAIFAMDLPRLLTAGLFNFSLAIFAGLFGLTQTLGDVLGFDPLNDRFWRNLLSGSSPLMTFLAAHRAAAIAAGIGLLLVAGAATGLVRTVLRDFGFRLERTDTSLRRRRGLLTRTDVSLPIRRVQAAIVGSGPVRNLFGWRELKFQNLAADEGSGDHVVAPLANEAEVDAVLAALGWRGADIFGWRRVSFALVWMRSIAVLPLLFLFGAQIALFALAPLMVEGPTRALVRGEFSSILLVLSLIVGMLLLSIGVRAMAWRGTAFVLDGDRLLVRTGWWRRRLRILPVCKIQSIDIAESFLSRWFGVVNLVFGVAGGQGFSAHNIPAVPREEARELRKQLLDSTA